MSGPPYPPVAVGGDNAIGRFQIGVSPIGDIPPFDFRQTIISQYANSPIITTLLDNFDQYIDQTQNVEDFFDLIWNIDTAVGYGLDVWGRIVGVLRILSVSTVTFLGFEQASPTVESFGSGIFYSGTPATGNYRLTDESYRTLLFAKALANICDGSIPAINQILLNLFPNRGRCYVTDGQNMTMTYTFEFALSQVEVAIVTQSGVLPKPAGVAASIVIS